MSARLTSVVACVTLLALGSCGDPAPVIPERGDGPRTVVLVSLDTLRPERLGVYGNEVGVSPVLDAFAQEAAVFEQALSSAPWTLPAHMTMLTGLDTVAHGVLNAGRWLSGEVVTLAEALGDAGYTTAAFTDGGFASGSNGLEQGFELFDDERSDEGANGFTRILPRALAWLEDRPADEDLFLFLHTFDAHTPYDSPPEETLARFRARPVEADRRDAMVRHTRWLQQQVRVGLGAYDQLGEVMNDYDAGVHHADAGLGQVFDTLRALGRYDDALIVVTSDHGEAFLEHGLHIGHGIGIKDTELRVPLIVRFPAAEGSGQRHDELVGLVDIARTVLDVEGVPAADHTQGESLLGLVRGRKRRVDWVLGASTNMRTFFLVQNDWKYVSPMGILPMQGAERHLGPRTPDSVTAPKGEVEYEVPSLADPSVMETVAYDQAGDPLALGDKLPAHELLFDRRADPGEFTDLSLDEPDRLAQMRKLFQGQQAKSDAINVELIDLDSETVTEKDPANSKVLAALGYLATGSKDDYRAVPKKMREAVLKRTEKPDMTVLIEADAEVHAVRLSLRTGAAATGEQLGALRDAAEAYITWRRANPAFRPRVDWRLFELHALVTENALDVDVASLLAALRAGR